MKRHWCDELELHTPTKADKVVMNPANSFNKVTRECIDMMHHFEGWHNEAYLDPIGIPTIGVGFIDGVKMGDYMTDEEIVIRLRQELSRFKKGVGDLVNVKITQSMFDALVSFSYNLGVGSLQRSTLLAHLKSGNYQDGSQEFLRWNRAGGRVLLGLQRRRDAERLMFLGEDWQNYRRDF